jgi:hypothetical protein
LHDSVEYLEDDPIVQFIQLVGDAPDGGGVTILYNYKQLKDEVLYVAPCGQVIFQNTLSVPVTITFDNPEATSVCVNGDVAGNIDTLAPQQGVVRKFRQAGAYGWTVTHLDGSPFRPAVSDTVHIRDRTAF